MTGKNSFLAFVLSVALLISGCGGSGGNSNKIEFEKNKDYKPDEVKKIVFHDKHTDDIMQVVQKKLTSEEAKKFKRSILLTHQVYGAKAEGKTVAELLDLKLTREEVRKIKFDPGNYQAAYEAVGLSELSDKEKKAFETCVRGYNPNVWKGMTIGEMLDKREKDKKMEESEQKAPANPSGLTKPVTPVAPPMQAAGSFGANDLLTQLSSDYDGKMNKQLMNKTIKITGPVYHKDFSNDQVVLYLGHTKKVSSYVDLVQEGTVLVALNSSDINLLNRIQENMFISVVGTYAGPQKNSTNVGKVTYTVNYYVITNAQITN